MSDYTYEDREGDRLLIRPVETSEDTYIVTNNGIGVWLTAAEAPKAAQAILDAAGVQGAILTDLPEVTKGHFGAYEATNFTSYHQSDLTKLEREAKALVAIWLQRKADEADKERQVADAKAEATELKALEELKAKIEAEKAHDDLRTSPIALKALEIYNRACIGCGPYESWDATLDGDGVGDDTIRHFIGLAEAEEVKEKEAAEKLAARRDELVQDHVGNPFRYLTARPSVRSLVDRIIELEDAK